ncbi:MAG: hypothetical protein KJ749_13315, partial [Planctomycetes bacterium]|nr:hypothetical protein [Planctomycetota bacterium]
MTSLALGRLIDVAQGDGRRLVEWVPPAPVCSDVPLPCRFSIGKTEDGRRIVVPLSWVENDVEAIILCIKTLYFAGLAICAHRERFSPATLDQWRVMPWLFEWARCSPEHADRGFACLTDLLVLGTKYAVKSGLISEVEDGHTPHVIPPEFGVWDLPGVLAVGKDAAERAGHCLPDAQVQVRYGLIEVARLALRNEKYAKRLCELDLRRIVFEALYADDLDDAIMAQATEHRIVRRLSRWLVRHRRQTTEEFMRLLMAAGASLVAALVRPKKGGGPIDPKLGRQLLIALGWHAYSFLAAGIASLMANFKALISPALTDAEAILFDDFYLPQPHYGGLPFLLLRERSDFLEPVTEQLWNSGPCPELTRLLRASLSLYGRMIRTRRAIDRELHRPKLSRAPSDVAQDRRPSAPGRGEEATSAVDDHDALTHHIYKRIKKPCNCPPDKTEVGDVNLLP